MNNIDALTLPDCQPHEGQDAWYFPCGLGVSAPYGAEEAIRYTAADETRSAVWFPDAMITVAHRRHHDEQHDEMDQWSLVNVLDPRGQVHEMWCECIQQDTYWRFIPLFHPHPQIWGTEYS